MQYAGTEEALRAAGGVEGSPAVVAKVGKYRGEGEEEDVALNKQVINVAS